MRRQPDDWFWSDELPREHNRQVVLTKMQDVRASSVGNIGPIVNGQERSMRATRFPEHLQVTQFLGSFQALLPELDDVDAIAQHLVKEPRQVALGLPGVGAEVQPGRCESVKQVITLAELLFWHSSEG